MLIKENSLSIGGFSDRKRLKAFRPFSAIPDNRYLTIKIKPSSTSSFPPQIFTMPNNKKMIRGLGNNIEKEKLYENNILLREELNKLKRELAETKYQVVKKDLESREKEKIIKNLLKQNLVDSENERIIGKAEETISISLLKEKYNNLKDELEKQISENKILKANLKLTKIKEFQIENDILNNELNKMKSLYENSKTSLKGHKNTVDQLIEFKEKLYQQHAIINSYKEKCQVLGQEINNLKNERNNLEINLEKNINRQLKLKREKNKLIIKNKKFLEQKKRNEEIKFKSPISEKEKNKLIKSVEEFKRSYYKQIEINSLLKKEYESKGIKVDKSNYIKPFKYQKIKFLQSEKVNKSTDKCDLYKSLLDEYKLKNALYEKYFEDNNIKPEEIAKKYGYHGILNSENRIFLLNKNNRDSQIDFSDSQNAKKENENNAQKNEIIKVNDINENNKNKNKNEEENTINNDNKITGSNTMSTSENKTLNSINTKNNINDIIKEEEEHKETISQVDVVGEELKTKFSDDNFSNTNTKSKTNNVLYNNYNSNINLDEDDEIRSLFHVFLKNFEANHITFEIVDLEMKNITKSFEGKKESTKEEFLDPFINLFLKNMKVTKEEDKKIVISCFDNLINILKGDTNEFLVRIMKILENLVDYSIPEYDKEFLMSLAYILQKYKSELEQRLKEENKDGLINFNIFTKIVKEINLQLDDRLMEYLFYKMKSSVPENHSIFDLNPQIITECLNMQIPEDFEYHDIDELSNKINDKLTEFSNKMIDDQKDLEKVYGDKVKTFNVNDKEYECIEKDIFFDGMEKYGVTLEEEIKNKIYEFFIVDEPTCTNDGKTMMMDFSKLKTLFTTGSISG